MYKKQYLAKRPFLVITTKFTPATKSTQVKGWADTHGWESAEEVAVVDRVTTKHLTYASIVIDVLEAKVVTCNFQGVTRDEAMQHYLSKYKQQVTQAVSIWMEQEARKKALEMRKAGIVQTLEQATAETTTEVAVVETETVSQEAASTETVENPVT